MNTEYPELFNFAKEGLKTILLRHLPEDGIFATRIPGVFIARCSAYKVAEHRFDRPHASLFVQGSKKTAIGNYEYTINEGQVLTICVDMPSSSINVESSPEYPMLAIFFNIDQQLVRDIVLELGLSERSEAHIIGVCVTDAGVEFMDGMFRLARLLENPGNIALRAENLLRDMHYLLLTGPQREVILNLYGSGTYGPQLFKAIEYLKEHYSTHVRADELAYMVNMSKTSLYRHFRELTGLSPLQYHKQLRLHEARRLILAEHFQASIAAMKVGYESATQFSREYKRLFGQTPYKSKKEQSED